MVAHIEQKNDSCQKELQVIKRMHIEEKMRADSRIPVASIQDFDTAGSISERLSDLLDRTRDTRSFIEMRDSIPSHFKVFFTTRAERNMCRRAFAAAYKGGIEHPELQQACASFDQLRSCLIEIRHIDRISEYMREDVSNQFYDGSLEPRGKSLSSKVSALIDSRFVIVFDYWKTME